jgi:hypothetical protein
MAGDEVPPPDGEEESIDISEVERSVRRSAA